MVREEFTKEIILDLRFEECIANKYRNNIIRKDPETQRGLKTLKHTQKKRVSYSEVAEKERIFCFRFPWCFPDKSKFLKLASKDLLHFTF